MIRPSEGCNRSSAPVVRRVAASARSVWVSNVCARVITGSAAGQVVAELTPAHLCSLCLSMFADYVGSEIWQRHSKRMKASLWAVMVFLVLNAVLSLEELVYYGVWQRRTPDDILSAHWPRSVPFCISVSSRLAFRMGFGRDGRSSALGGHSEVDRSAHYTQPSGAPARSHCRRYGAGTPHLPRRRLFPPRLASVALPRRQRRGNFHFLPRRGNYDGHRLHVHQSYIGESTAAHLFKRNNVSGWPPFRFSRKLTPRRRCLQDLARSLGLRRRLNLNWALLHPALSDHGSRNRWLGLQIAHQ